MLSLKLLFIILTLYFKTVISIELDCELAKNPDYKSLIKYYDLRSKTLCGFKYEDGMKGSTELNMTIDQKLNKTDQDVMNFVYTTTEIPILSPELFKKFTNLTRCFFYNISTNVVERDWFKNAQSLKKLHFFENNIPVLGGERFVVLLNLLELEMLYSNIKKVEENAFVGLKNLTFLDLSNNRISYLHPNAFNNLVSLIKLRMTRNPITELSPTIFRSLLSLEVLYITYSQLESIPDGIFLTNKNLKKFDFNEGKISKIPKKIFSHLKMIEINLQDNFCISEKIYGAQLKNSLTEDILTPCSCDIAKTEDSGWKLRMLLKCFGVSAGIILIAFACALKYNNQTNKTNITKNESQVGVRKVIANIIKEYIRNSTIQGLTYVANESSFLIDRIMWMGVVLALFTALSYYSFETFIRWQNRPAILEFDEEPTPIFEIPFPAVTFCPVSKFDKSIFDVEKVYREYRAKKCDNQSMQLVESASIICSNMYIYSPKNPRELIVAQVLKENKLQIGAYFRWRNRYISNNSTYTLTKEGICETFNAIDARLIFRNDTVDPRFLDEYQERRANLAPHFWSMDQGYQSNVNNYPYRAYDPISNTLTVNVALPGENLDIIDTFCNKYSMKFKLFFSHPAEVLDSSNNHFFIPFNKSVVVLITPKITKTSESLRSYDPLVRNCYFPGERQLKFFQIYTRANCEMECLTNLTLRYCNCSAFFMPRGKETEICDLNKYKRCLDWARQMRTNEYQVKVICDSKSLDYPAGCTCLPPCNQILYEAEIIQKEYKPEYYAWLGRTRLNIVKILFKESEFMAIRRSEQFSFIDFISNCGGLMGLFMGISILSVFEILYYFGYLIIRRICSKGDRVHDIRE